MRHARQCNFEPTGRSEWAELSMAARRFDGGGTRCLAARSALAESTSRASWSALRARRLTKAAVASHWSPCSAACTVPTSDAHSAALPAPISATALPAARKASRSVLSCAPSHSAWDGTHSSSTEPVPRLRNARRIRCHKSSLAPLETVLERLGLALRRA